MNIRESIFCHEMFHASNYRSTCGFGADHIRQTEETWDYTDDEFSQELGNLEKEGIVEKINSSGSTYFQATKAGLVARERNYQERGLRHPSLINKTLDIGNAIVALMSCDDYGMEVSQFSEFDMEELHVYLWNHDDTCIREAVIGLERDGIIRKSQIEGWGERYYLTAAGRIKYARIILPELGLSSPETILDKPKSPAPKFAGPYSENLKYRWLEAEKCQASGLWLSATAMYGSILETVLIWALKRQGDAALSSSGSPGKGVPVEGWRLDVLIKVSEDLNLVDKALVKYAHVLRDARNLIHPSKQIKENHYPTCESTQIAQQVVRGVLDSVFRNQ